MNKTTQEILNFFFTKEVKDLTPVDYQEYVEDRPSDFPILPAGTVVLSSGNNGQDADLLVVRTPDNIYHLVDENEGIEEFDETPEVDPTTPISELYEITHSFNRSQYHYTSYTSYTGILLHNIIDEDDYYMGGFYIFNKEYIGRRKAH